VPASPWLRQEKLGKPKIALKRDPTDSSVNIEWKPTGHGKTWLWLVQIKRRSAWQTIVQPADQTSHNIGDWLAGQRAAEIAVTPVDRCGNLGPQRVVEVDDSTLPPPPRDILIDRPPRPKPLDGRP
jgi:hypothetical protein